ncbi:MAG: hypothetical protein J6B86_07095 [Clostridia bacterium]|nr:hypothetical protein [Clostridia bacterium]
MKKFLSLILVVILCGSLCACGNGGSSAEEDREGDVRRAVYQQILTETMFYEKAGTPTVTYYFEEISEYEYEVTGKVTIKDKYGDTYTGKYDAVVNISPTDGKCAVDLELGTLYKD